MITMTMPRIKPPIGGYPFTRSIESILDLEDAAIISKYLSLGKCGLLACQEELENAGLGNFAKL